MSLPNVLTVGVIVERCKIDHPWQDHKWRPVGVVAGGPQMEPWTMLVQQADSTQVLVGDSDIELHRKETPAYKHNMESGSPSLYVVLRRTEEDEHPLKVQLVTASPYEAEAYLESGDEIVESVPMPALIAQWVCDFIDTHHIEEVFKKRQRNKVDIEEHKFGQEPIVSLRQRMARGTDD